jgi:hypothetical protein
MNENLLKIVDVLLGFFKEQILEQLDFWFYVDDYAINFYDQEHEGLLTVVAYPHKNGITDYSEKNSQITYFKYEV